MKFHFSGYATKFNVKCTDGRTIKPGAFAHNDGQLVPLVWQHGHNSPVNVIGHAKLECRDDGVYAYGTFNETETGEHCKELVKHGDVKALSIFANQLKEKLLVVSHGVIKELSLVLAGANPEAFIDYVTIAHGDDLEVSESEAIIYTDFDDVELSHKEGEIEDKVDEDDSEDDTDDDQDDNKDAKDTIEHSDMTIKEVFNTLNEEQQEMVYALIGAVAEGDDEEDNLEQSDEDDDNLQHSNEGGQEEMKSNVFDKNSKAGGPVLEHADVVAIFTTAEKGKMNLSDAVMKHMDGEGNEKLKEAFIKHAGTYGIENIDVLFPDAQNVMNTPEFDMRRAEWVRKVIGGVHKVPFSRIRSMYADITADEARAKGYIKGNEKIEEVFPIFKRTTEPTTIYKKQKLDRDDVIDITDFNVVMWLKSEMRLMLDEERARAYLIGDGRSGDNPDKIDELKIRPIYKDDDKYSIKVQLAADATGLDELEALKKARKDYKGTGNPTLYTTAGQVIDWTLLKDGNENYRFRDAAEVAKFLSVKEIVEVEVMEGVSRDVEGTEHDLLGIIVNLKDYTSGADKGGNIALFDDFDIDFNQYKYLMETRCSGALTKLYSALVVEKAQPAG